MPQEHTLPPRNIPELSFLAPQSEWAGLTRALAGGGSRDPVAWALQLNVVRLLDAAVRDYEFGRQSINAFHGGAPHHFGLLHIIESTTHFENCIWHFERFIKHAKALRACSTAERELKLLIPKNSEFLRGAVEGKVTALRHGLAHLEGKHEKIPPGTGLALLPQDDGLVIGEHIIGWGELVSWLTGAHSCTSDVSRFRPLAPSPAA
jgi:hypothetical protein